MIKVSQLIKLIVLAISVYILVFAYKNYDRFNSQKIDYLFNYRQLILEFNKEWSDDQFISQFHNKITQLKFRVHEDKNMIVIGDNKYSIPFQSLSIQIEDARTINKIQIISNSATSSISNQIIRVSSKFFTILYNLSKNIILYQKIHLQKCEDIYHIDSNNKIWVISIPQYNIILLRVYSSEHRALMYTNRYQVKQKVQLIKSIYQQQGSNKLVIKLLTFSRDYLSYQFNAQTCNLIAIQQTSSHSIRVNPKLVNMQQPVISLSQSLRKRTQYQLLQQFLYKISHGHIGKQRNTSTSLESKDSDILSDLYSQKQYKILKYLNRQKQQQYNYQILDQNNSVVIQYDHSLNMTNLISFGQVMVPLRTPVFVNKEDVDQLMPFDQVLNKSKNTEEGQNSKLPSIDFKLYGIKSKNLQIISGKTGLYRLLPDSSVHFMAFDEKFLNFYPSQNVKQQEYYTIRTAKGGIALKQNQIKGLFSQPSVPNEKAIQLKFGYSKDQIYQQISTSAVELGAGIYQSHIIHKGLFTKLYKNRLDLITSLSGKAILSHYFSRKQNYEYTSSYIQNNQFWIFQHHITNSPKITKYQLFLNSSAPKTALNIKREYNNLQLPQSSRVIRIQKCIDFFYYITYVTQDSRYGIVRVSHPFMNNRQPKADQTYSGAFEKMMITDKFPRSLKFNVTADEEEILKLQFSFQLNQILKYGKQMDLKHQYKILPLRVISLQNRFYAINFRKNMLNAFDYEMQKLKSEESLKILFFSGVLVVILTIGILFSLQSKQKTIIVKNQQPLIKKQDKKEDKKKKDKKQ